MPFDTFAMAAVADEIRDATLGGQIQRIIQPSASTIVLAVYAGGSLHRLVLSADARYGRAHLGSERLAKGFATPSAFIMLLRKHLEGVRVAEIRRQPYERVLQLVCGAGERGVTLVAEIMGKHSNVILTGAEGRILGALKIVPTRQSSVRPILPGGTYAPPPAQSRDESLYGPGPRLDPAVARDDVARLLGELPRDTRVRSALLGLLVGAGPFLADQITRRAGSNGEAAVGYTDADVLADAAAEMYSLYAAHRWEPWTFVARNGKLDCAPYRPEDVRDAVRSEAMSLAVEQCLGSGENTDALASARARVLAAAERALGAARRRAASLAEGLSASEDADATMERGRMLLAYQYLIEPGASELRIPDLDMVIPLHPALKPRENAERAFRRYRKLRDARARIPDLLAGAEREAARVEDITAFVRLAGTEAELRALERELVPVEASAGGRSRPPKRTGPNRFHLDGFTALVGRNASENEEVTFRLARRDDLWLHARQRTGAHVALQGSGDTPSDHVVEAAARLAAYFSEGRNDTAVDVDVARVRDVRKIPGGPPGRVTYRNESTIRVAPALGDWEPLSR